MRAKNVSFNLFLILLFAIGFINCFNDFETNRVKLHVTSHNDLFSAETVPNSSVLPAKIKIREDLQETWNLIPCNKIKNFEYQKGYNYELLVKRQDGTLTEDNNQNYSLVRILSKTKDIKE